MPESPSFIECENLVKIYRIGEAEVMALQGLDLNVRKGELMGIVGASGSGKSTLLNVLGGLDLPSAGRVTVGGRNLLRLSPSELNVYRRSEVGFVWQQTARNLIPYLTALENIELPMVLAGVVSREGREWARELLEAVELGDRRNHKLAQMSGGEQQRVAIAVALGNRPTLLLADEPTGELDTATARVILETLGRLNRAYDLTTIIVTHDQQTAGFVDRVVQIRDGKTSTERIRRNADKTTADEPAEHDYHEYVVLDSAGRLQLPQDYREHLDIGDRVEMDLLEEGVLIRPVTGRGLAGLTSGSREPQESQESSRRRRWWHRRKGRRQ